MIKKECAFCPNKAVLTCEHLWGQWVGRIIPKNKYRMIRTEPDGTVRSWPVAVPNATAKVVCATCNSTWMSDLENRAKQIIAEMVLHGSHKTLDAHDTATIAALSLSKAIVADRMCEEREQVLSSTERYGFARTLRFPRGVQMWLSSTSTLRGIFDSHYLESPVNALGRDFKGQNFTFGIGHLVIQTVILRWEPRIRGRDAHKPYLAQGTTWDAFAIPFWPSNGTPVSWPAQHLPNELFYPFVQRWNRVNLR